MTNLIKKFNFEHSFDAFTAFFKRITTKFIIIFGFVSKYLKCFPSGNLLSHISSRYGNNDLQYHQEIKSLELASSCSMQTIAINIRI